MSQPVVNLSRSSLGLTRNQLAGLVQSIKIAFPEEVAMFPEANGIELGSIISFTSGGGFRDWHHTPKTGLVRSEVVGQNGGQCFRNRIEFTIPSNEPELILNVTAMLNKRVIALGKDTQGRYRVVGSMKRPAVVRSNTSSGRSRSDSMGARFVIETFSKTPALFYTAGNPIEIENPPGTPIGGGALALENGLYYDADSRTGKLGGVLIEKTFIEAGFDLSIGNRSENFSPGSQQHKEVLKIGEAGIELQTESAFGLSKLVAFDGDMTFYNAPDGHLKFDDPDILGSPESVAIPEGAIAPVKWIRAYFNYELNRRNLTTQLFTITFNADADSVTIKHDKNSRAVKLQVYDSNWEVVETGIQLVDLNNARIFFSGNIRAGTTMHVVV